MEYVIPPIVTEVTVKLTTPEPELDAENRPVKVAAKLSLPAIGTVWVIVRVKVPEAAMVPVPLTNVWKLPKLEPVGVFKLVDPRPVNVIINALPMPPKKVTEFVPLPAQPAQVKVPDVEKVTGSAFAVDAPTAMKPASSTVIRVILMKRAMCVLSPLSTAFDLGRTSIELGVVALRDEQTGILCSGHGTQVIGQCQSTCGASAGGPHS
jgi:hypothetical protein